jgi:hypothetical protein
MRLKFVIFGHEIIIRREYDSKLHSTYFPEKEYKEIPVWEHKFPMDKRINIFTEFNGFTDYVFRNYDLALLNYGESALFHLEAILNSFRETRQKFEAKGATDEQLKEFDEKIYGCFRKTMNAVEKKTEELEAKESEDLQYHLKVMRELKAFKIEDYYKDKEESEINKRWYSKRNKY